MSLNLKKETILKLNANLKEVVGGQKPSRKIWNEEMTVDGCKDRGGPEKGVPDKTDEF